MKKKLITLGLAATLLFCNPSETQAKTIMVPYEKVTESFIEHHQNDTIYAYVQGVRIKRNGDGLDTDGYYIKYPKGKRGTLYTTIFRFVDHPRGVDDFEERIDIKGWVTPTAN